MHAVLLNHCSANILFFVLKCVNMNVGGVNNRS